MATFSIVNQDVATLEYGTISLPYCTPVINRTGVMWKHVGVSSSSPYRWDWGSSYNPGPVSNFTFFNADSPFWIHRNGALNPLYADVTEERRVLTLVNGNYFTVKPSSSDYLKFMWYDSNDSLIWVVDEQMYYYGQENWHGFALFKDEESGDTLFTKMHFGDYSSSIYASGVQTSGTQAEINRGYHIFDNAEPILWESWNKINGNAGQYSCQLTMISTDEIASNITDYHVYNVDDFTRLSSASSIWSAYYNSSIGDENVIAYSGAARLTLTVNNVTGQEYQKEFVFKFYIPDATTPFYTYSDILTVSGETPGIITTNYYLSFLYDDDKMVGTFYPISYQSASSLTPYTFNGSSISSSEMETMWMWLHASDAGTPDENYPYDSGTEDNGGNPSGYMGTQADITQGNVPQISGTASGMFTLYRLTDSDLSSIAAFLWSDDVLDNFKKYFNNFSDNIIALYVLPYTPSNLPTKAFKVGRVASDTLTAVEYVTSRFVSIDMGSLDIGSNWGSYLDFAPYTKMSIYLPGVGVQNLDVDEIMCPTNADRSLPSELGSTLSVEYVLDLMTGVCVAYVKVNGQIRYQFPGQVGYSIPLTGETHRSLLQGFAMATAGGVGMLVTGGAAAPFAASAATAGIINAMKPDVFRSGNLSGDPSAMSLQTPILITSIPNKPLLVNQQIFTGYPSYKTGLLSEFDGYTKVVDVHTEGFACTEDERNEIIDLLRNGVIL